MILLGYHGKAALLALCSPIPSINSRVIADVRCNGRPLGELGLNTALAAHHGAVPVLVAGDGTVAPNAADVASGIHAAVVKRALGRRAAAMCTPRSSPT